MAKRDRTKVLRNSIITFVAALVVVVLGYGLVYITGATESDVIVEGKHYRTLDRPAVTDPIEVIEFFSYVCIHCMTFEPTIDKWKVTLPAEVQFTRKHVSFSPETSMLSRAHLALQHLQAIDQNHSRIFNAIHNRNKQFNTIDQIADFVDGYGVNRIAFLNAYNGGRITRLSEQSRREWSEYRLSGTPALVVGNKYVINTGIGRAQSLAVVDKLIAELISMR